MFSKLTEIAEEHGVVDERSITKRISYMQPREINALFDQLAEALRDNQTDSRHLEPSSFNFFVSSSMRGDRLCVHPLCRLKKVPLIERYAALYGDHLLLPIQMRDDSKSRRRLSAEALLLSIAEMRPLIDAAMVIPITAGLCVCKDCLRGVTEETGFVSEIGRQIANRHISEFRIQYDYDNRRRKHVFTISGPDQYVDGSYTARVFDQVPEWLPQRLRGGGGWLNKEEVVVSNLVVDLFNVSAYDIVSQTILAKGTGCSYLSDSEAEAAFFDDPRVADSSNLSTSQFAESLMHEIPLFSEVPTNAVLKLRRENPEGFAAYRSALVEASSKQADIAQGGALRAREFYRDVLEPKVNALRSLEVTANKSSLAIAGITLALPTISLLFGLVDQGLPHTVAETAKVLGAAGLAKAVTDPIIEKRKKIGEIQANPFFFLLKMDKEWRRLRQSCG